MRSNGEVWGGAFLFIRHARANVVNDNIPPHTSPRSLGADRSCQRLGDLWRARPVHRGPEVFRRKASPILHRGVIPKRGYVTQRSGVPPSPKSSFAAFSGKGHEAIFEF